MAMTKCKECRQPVSSKAATCPHCGARVARQNSGCGTLIVVIFLGTIIVGAIGSMVGEQRRESSSTPAPATTPKSEKTAAEKEAEDAEKQKKDGQIAMAQVGAKTLKSSMRDPDSFKLETALVMENGSVCYEYRARNGFGGMNRGQAVLQASGKKIVFKSSEEAGFNSLWNRECANKSGEDVADGINLFGL